MPMGKVGGNLLATEEVPAEKTQVYGVIDPGETVGALTEVRGLVEKPDPAKPRHASVLSAATSSSPR